MTIDFISDLHLSPAEPASTDAFLGYLVHQAREADALWILGDLFEYWAGDDDVDGPFNTAIADALQAFVTAGVPTKLIVGNRDFLLGEAFTHRTGVEIVAEPVNIVLGEQQCLLLHGDVLCTDDHAYQQFRSMVRNPAWQARFLAQPLAVRHEIAEDLRAKSEMSKQGKALEIMDVNADAVAQAFRDSSASLMIHGHTHRPARHALNIDGTTCIRHVLPDWHGHACGLRWDGKKLQSFGSP
ncbi:MAG: UDP-2,3-diacylglucosamine diphosphatase [Rhodocyclales bacterium]|nr:UDP-2,3-diacylglucosamine diphosphatase [Rhodocyclales bacterium]